MLTKEQQSRWNLLPSRLLHSGHWPDLQSRELDINQDCRCYRQVCGNVLGISFVQLTVTCTCAYGESTDACLSSFFGVVLVSFSDSSQPQSLGPTTPSAGMSDLPSMPIVGDALALLSALFYALYVTLLKVRVRSESRIDMQLFFGFVGLFNILVCWPIGVVLHLTGVEPFQLPYTGKVVTALLINVRINRLAAQLCQCSYLSLF